MDLLTGLRSFAVEDVVEEEERRKAKEGGRKK